jgi:hypothetical protein
VRDLALDVFLVCAKEPRQFHLLVVNGQVESLADQGLYQSYHRALAQVVGAGLEAKPEDSDISAPGAQHHGNGALDLPSIRGKHRA